MQTADVIIVGAGATGLMAAHTLTKAGKKVTILEARNRCGGRIHTLNEESFFKKTELGAEFIHGNLPVTLGLLKEAGIQTELAVGEMLHYRDGKFSYEGGFDGWDEVLERLNALETDVSIKQFLDTEFPGDENAGLRQSVIRFVSGYDTADHLVASSFALRDEWSNEDDDAQHRVVDGYGTMIKYLENSVKKAAAEIYLNTVVKQIDWQQGEVKVTTDDGSVYNAGKLLIALPLGVLKADGQKAASVAFEPAIAKQKQAIAAMGFGAIIKVLLEFDEPFWESDETAQMVGVDLKNIGFILSSEVIPTWWAQLPEHHNPVLTGWFGGPEAAKNVDTPTEELLQRSLQSLSNIFKRSVEKLKDKLVAFNIINWTAEPYTLGSYAYDTIDARASRKVLREPVAHTLYFAGEYLYEGPAMGTVEAALTSGLKVAEKMIN